MSVWVLVGLALTLLASAAAWRWPARWQLVVVSAGLLACSALAASLLPATAVLRIPGVLLGAGCAIVGGGPVTVSVLRVAPDTSSNRPSAQVLRAGATIGLLERTAVASALLAGWPEGLAIALAIKALGRYPELRTPGTSERFIVGTFASVLWAAACAGVVYLPR